MEARPAFTLSEEEEHALEHQELGEHALLNDQGNGSHRPTQVRGVRQRLAWAAAACELLPPALALPPACAVQDVQVCTLCFMESIECTLRVSFCVLQPVACNASAPASAGRCAPLPMASTAGCLLRAPSSCATPSSAPPQAVFNLDLDYSDDDALLDWEQYAGGCCRTGTGHPCCPGMCLGSWWVTVMLWAGPESQ